MSDILFCTTDGFGFQEGLLNLALSYQVSSLINLKPDIFGLQSWEELKDTIDFSKYKLIWLHLNPRVMYPPWYIFPHLIKKMAPDTPMFLKHEYWEKYHDETMPYILKRYFNFADYVATNSKVGKDILEENLDIPVFYTHIGIPQAVYLNWPEPIPWEDKWGIFAIHHTSQDPMLRKFEIAKDADLPLYVLDSDPFADPQRMKNLQVATGGEGECYTRLPWEQYMEVMNKCRVAVEIDYVGICRMAYECAKVRVPVVGWDLTEYRNILYPDLTLSTPESISDKIIQVHNGSEPKRLNMYADTILHTYWNKEACRGRLLKLLREGGYEP